MLRTPFIYALLWTAVLMVGFSLPGQSHGHSLILTPDKLAHFGGFLILAVLWLRVYPSSLVRVVVCVAAFGIFSEVYQHVMPIERSFDLADIVADLCGLFAGVQLPRALARFKKSRGAEQL